MKAREIAPIIKMSISSAARDSKTVKEMMRKVYYFHQNF